MADGKVLDEVSVVIKSSADDAAKSVKALSNELTGLNSVLKGLSIAGFVRGMKSIGSTIFGFVNKMSDYIETMNQFRTVMGESSEAATQFIDKAERILGLDPSKMQSALSTFQSLGESFGISSDRAYIMSKNLTQLAADMSSFKNISFEQALQKIKSGFVGEIEPMRAVGVALDKVTLQETAYRLGIEQRIDTMTRAQKTELLYYQMLASTSQMQGDLARTLISPANAIRQIQTEFAQLGRAIGSIFIPMLMKAVPYIRAITELATEAAQAIAAMFGFKLGDYESDISSVGASLGGVSDGISDIGDSARGTTKELKKMLMPFDELNNINFNTGGGSGGGTIGGVGGSLGIPLPEYDMFAGASDEMRKKIDSIKKAIKDLLPVIQGVVTALATMWAVKKILDFIIYLAKVKEAFSSVFGFLKKLPSGVTEVGSALLKVAAIIGGLVLAAKGFIDMNSVMQQAFKDGSIDGAKFAGALAEIAGGFSLVGLALGGIKGAAIGALIGLVVGFVQALMTVPQEVNEFKKSAEELNKVVAEQKEIVDKDVESWNALSESTKESVAKQVSQADHIRSLVSELDNLVDANGRVQDGDKARVDFILNELNEAYGTEYELVGNQITQNGKEVESLEKLKDAIEQVIKKKEAEALIDATTDKYAEALQKKSQYYSEYQNALKNQKTAAEKLQETFKRYGITIDEVNDKTLQQAINFLKGKDAFNAVEDGLQDLLTAYENSSDSVQKSSQMWEEASNTIIDIEALKTAVLQDDYSAIEKGIDNLTETIEIDGKRQVRTTQERLKEQLDTYKNYYGKMTEEQKKAFDNQLKHTAETLAEETNTVQTLTPENVAAWKELAETANDVYTENISKVSEGTRLAIETANGQIDINSPQSIERWRKLAESDATSYNQALEVLPEDTRRIIQNAIGKIDSSKDSMNKTAYETAASGGRSANQGFYNNLNLSITSSNISLGSSWGFNTVGKTISTWIQQGMNSVYFKVATSVERIPGYATGGFPETGQLFMANESGPELVGNIGRRTAVANQDQITEGIASATYSAISRALAENKSGGATPYITVNVGNERLYSGYGKYQDEQSNMYGVTV